MQPQEVLEVWADGSDISMSKAAVGDFEGSEVIPDGLGVSALHMQLVALVSCIQVFFLRVHVPTKTQMNEKTRPQKLAQPLSKLGNSKKKPGCIALSF